MVSLPPAASQLLPEPSGRVFSKHCLGWPLLLALLITMASCPVASANLVGRTHRHEGAEHCGSWQREYTNLHVRIRSDNVPPTSPEKKFLTFVCEIGKCGGIGDILVGLVSAFVVALMQDRALVIDFEHMTQAFDAVNIDWRLKPDVPSKPLKVHRRGPPKASPGDVTLLNLHNADLPRSLEEFFGGLESASNIRLLWNRGILTKLFTEGGPWRDRLHAKGLRLPFAFGCILRYLLTPSVDVRRLVHASSSLLSDPVSVTAVIGIHVRTADISTWDTGKVGERVKTRKEDIRRVSSSAQRLFDCAQKLEDFWFADSSSVRWLLMSSSKALKEAMKEKYGEKIITTDVVPIHIELQGIDSDRGSAFQSTVAEWWLFSQCDKFVFTESGFSKTAALYSLRPMASYMLGRYADSWRFPEWEDRCEPDEPTSMAVMGNASRWSGV